MTENQFKEITEWQDKTFPGATTLSKLAHLKEELVELQEALQGKGNTGSIGSEFADCFLLLYGTTAKHGYTYEQICNEIEYKFIINKDRTWGKPDARGVVNHVK